MRIVLLALLVAATAAGCIVDDHPEERRAALRAFIGELELQPLPGDRTIRVGRTRSKSDYPYFTATGVLDEPSREAGMTRVAAAFERVGLEVFEAGPVPYFLGACVRARRGSTVAAAHVGWSAQSGFNPYPRLPGRVYVQTAVGHEDSNQGWAHPDRERCGSG